MNHPKFRKRAVFLLIILLMALSACMPEAADALPQDRAPLQDATPLSESAPALNPSPTAADVPAADIESAPEDVPTPIPPTKEQPTAVPPTATNPPVVEEAAAVSGPTFSGMVGSDGGLYGPQDLAVVAKTGKIQFLNVYANW